MGLKDIKIDVERLDVLDENGNKTGISKSKEEVHAKGLWHGTVQIWLMNSKGEILVQKRSHLKQSRPGKWDNSCAGHMAAGESAIETAVRELKEELNIDIAHENLELLYKSQSKQIEKNGAFINHQHNNVFLVEKDIDITKLTLQEEEVDEVRFIHHEELEQHFHNKTMDLDFYPDFYKNEIHMLFNLLKEKNGK